MLGIELELIGRIALAGLLGALLGLERELRGKDPGIRTHALVALGAAVFTVAGAYGFSDIDKGPNVDPARIAAQVATGIGFIGAGAVLRSGESVRGLTTAASLWVSAAIGVAAGAAAYGPLVAATLASLLILAALRIAKPKLLGRFAATDRVIYLEYERGHGTLGPVIRGLESIDCQVAQLQLDDDDEDCHTATGLRSATITVRAADEGQLVAVMSSVEGRPEVVAATIDPEPRAQVSARRGPLALVTTPEIRPATAALPEQSEKKVEVELQYLYTGDEPEVVPIELAGLGLARSTTRDIADLLLDDDRLSLRRARCSLRIRRTLSHQPRLIWKGPSSRREDGAKSRFEHALVLDVVPADGHEVRRVLEEAGLWETVAATASLRDTVELHAIGELRNHRSAHHYRSGLHELELVWDRLTYPVGPPETRMEVESVTAASSALLEKADAELQALFGSDLEPPTRGKCRELCGRLYPELCA
jgi:putative Mg2+ transporter-C (MgtC) family protein